MYQNLRRFIIIAKLASNYRRRTLEFHRCFPPFRPAIIKWLALSPSNVWYDVYNMQYVRREGYINPSDVQTDFPYQRNGSNNNFKMK